MQQLEDWLHQHIFKVGWLVTKNFQTTTILYYAFLMPGVFLYEFIIWLVAGLLDVRAERAISMPEKQEIGELRLNFVKISRKTPAYKMAIINIAPLIVGTAIIWFVASNVLEIPQKLALLNEGTTILSNLGSVIRELTTTTDFWLWVYLLFAIANTMMPDKEAVRGWIRGIGYVVIGTGALLLFGAGSVINEDIFTPIVQGLNTISGVFAFMIVLNVLWVAILGSIESTIEWITGDSATFKDGKMITMRRQDAKTFKREERQKHIQSRQEQKQIAPQGGLPSIYKLELPTPGAPGRDEPVSQQPTSILEPDEEPVVIEPPSRRRDEPDIITGIKINRPMTDDDKDGDDENVEDDDMPVRIQQSANTSLRSSILMDEDDDDLDDEDSSDITYEDFEDPA